MVNSWLDFIQILSLSVMSARLYILHFFADAPVGWDQFYRARDERIALQQLHFVYSPH